MLSGQSAFSILEPVNSNLDAKDAVVTEVFCGFHHFLQANAEILPPHYVMTTFFHARSIEFIIKRLSIRRSMTQADVNAVRDIIN
jgi:hypothetical protein